jgi:hypothetical protein
VEQGSLLSGREWVFLEKRFEALVAFLGKKGVNGPGPSV